MILIQQFGRPSLTYIYQMNETRIYHHFFISLTLNDDIVVTWTNHIPQLDIIGIQSNIKVFFINPKLISIPCLDILFGDEDVDVIFVNYHS